MKKFLLFLSAVCLAGCVTNDSEAERALKDNGFSDIEITDRSAVLVGFWGCGDDDGAAYKATAKNAAGNQVTVIVCCGGALSFKGCVVRSK
jgi:hypothetical protein